MGSGIVGWSAYLPYWRLAHEAVAAALGTAGGRGSRAVASYDEDATSMAVEAARGALRAGSSPTSVLLVTSAPPYLDKTNATAVHAALDLDPSAAAYDFGGAVRSAPGAIRAGAALAGGGDTVLVLLSDLRTGLPGGTDERTGGDAAAALVFGTSGAVAELAGEGHATAEFLDRWRLPGAVVSSSWEERFAEQVYVPMAEQAITDALKAAGVSASSLDHVLVAGPHLRATRRVLAAIGARQDALASDLVDVVGNCGAAHLGLLLCDVLDRAAPDAWILAVSLADGADALVLRTTARVIDAQRERHAQGVRRVADLVASGRTDLPYTTYLTWRELLQREAPRRPDPLPPAAPPARRTDRWKYGFVASRCDACGARHLPPARVCVQCRAKDQMTDERLADVRGTVATFTVDRLAYSLSPPVAAAVIDFDDGGRFSCELTDHEADEVRIGLRVELTFRRLFTARGVHNYFWKAKPARSTTEGGD